MRLIALLAFYDEPTTFLAAYVDGLAVAGVADLVALDGAYLLYPDGKASSPVACVYWVAPSRTALIEACRAAAITLHLHVPAGVWQDGEVDKRAQLMRLGDDIAHAGDWLLVLDADEHILTAPRDLVTALNAQPHDVATLELRRQQLVDRRSDQDMTTRERRLMRAGLGITVVSNHATYITSDRKVLWCAGREELQAPAYTVDGLHTVHMTRHRPQARHQARGGYYNARGAANIETAYQP